MDPDDAVDWTIRNQRVQGPMAWAWLLGWGVVWTAGAIIVERLTPMEWRSVVDITVLVFILVSFVVVIIHLERHPRVRRLKLGEQLLAVPRRRLEPKDVRALRLEPDPAEDYAESVTPVALCQLTVELPKRSPIRLVITTGDAARLRRWAERTGIPVEDPEGYSTGAALSGRPNACRDDRGLPM